MDEVEIRELLIDHVGHRCCWGSRPARTWKIHAVEDCNVYVGTLDTFIEEREVIKETEPYLGGSIDGKDNGPELSIWELDLRSQFPVLFVQYKEVREKIPHSEIVDKCSGKFCLCISKFIKSNFYVYYLPFSYCLILSLITKPWPLFPDCEGRGSLLCNTCNADQEPGYYKENQMAQCPNCYGRGLIAHKDGSDTL